jgi:hypothetical protein
MTEIPITVDFYQRHLQAFPITVDFYQRHLQAFLRHHICHQSFALWFTVQYSLRLEIVGAFCFTKTSF